MGNLINRANKSGPKFRQIVPNHFCEESVKSPNHPNKNFRSNRIKTTKYSVLTFLPKNLFEQFHRFANLYFLFVVALNWVPQVQAFGKEIAMIPIVFVLTVTAVKDAFEDFRRYKSDRKVNSSKCRVFVKDEGQDFHSKEWCDIHVGDIIHLSCNDIMPADIILLQSSDEQGICHVETMNLDGETNLKQRQSVTGIPYEGGSYKPGRFKYIVECEQPNAEIYKFNGCVRLSDKEGEIVPLNQNNILLRGCIMRNTDWIEGLVVYAGHETKSMMNNRHPRYKRSKLERALNRDVIWCVIILLFLCFFCAAGSALWLGQFEDSTLIPFIPFESSEQFNPYFQAFIVFFTYIIIFQSVIPLPLYVSLEIIKLLQIYFINQDLHLYHEPTDKRVECRALNITEDLGQVEYIFSDKTGTLTENQMEFKTCTIGGKNYPHVPEFDDDLQSETGSRYSLANVSRNSSIMENLKLETEIQRELSSMCLRSVGSIDLTVPANNHRNQVQEFFLLMAICNTVVVSLHPHEDPMDDEGIVASAANLQNNTRPNQNQNHAENPVFTEKYSKLPEPPIKKLAPITGQESSTPGRNGKALLPPISQASRDSLGLDREIFPRYNQRQEFMPKISTPTGSVAGSVAGSSIRSDMSRTRYEAESPDELALVRAASTYNCCLRGRTAKSVTVWLPGEGEVEFEVLHVLTFDSTRKRMSVIVKHPITKETILYTKGADSAVLSVLAKKYKVEDEYIRMRKNTEEHILEYAMQGLRTLCMARKSIPKAEYEKWARQHLEAESSIEGREDKLLESACRMECDLELLGATGIEDKLQDGVPETIANLRRAGIKIWVLTGDKQETAIQIAYSSQLFNPEQQLIVVNAEDKESTQDIMRHHLEEIILEEKTPHETDSSPPTKLKEYGLVIDGKTLAFALKKDLEKLFLMLAGKCNSVICCRSSPIQKGLVVKLAREELKVLTLAIGDGANDVSMIHMADVGIGISGQEGMQAVMASDFAIARFHFLERMLLVHGHWCYSRLARFSTFMFYKSLVSTMVLFWFNLYSGYSGATHIDSLFLMGQHVLFTAFPPIVNGIIDKDLSAETLLSRPTLYKVGQEGRIYTRLSFLIVFLDSIYQSVCIHFVCYFGYFESVGIWEFGTTMMVSLVLSILCHQAIETYRWMWPQWLTLILSFVIFWLFGIVIDSFFMTFDHPVTPYWVMQMTISKPIHAIIVLISVVTALLPRVIVRSLQLTIFPDEIMKAQLDEKMKAEEDQTEPNTPSETPDSGYRKDSKDSGYDNKALDMKHDSNNTDETVVPDVAVKNGRVRHRQNSNQKSDVAETST